jgi:phosphate/sulfate permease
MKGILCNVFAAGFLLMFAATSFLWLRQNAEQDGAAIQSRASSFNVESTPTGIHVSFVAGAADTSKGWSPVSAWHDTWDPYTEIVNGRPVRYQNVWHPPRQHLFGFQWERRAFSNGDADWRLVVPYPAALLLTGSYPIWRIARRTRRARGFEVQEN